MRENEPKFKIEVNLTGSGSVNKYTHSQWDWVPRDYR